VTQADPVRVLVVGDSYMPAGVFATALGGLGDTVSVAELQIDSTEAAPPRTDSERALREYVGDPAALVAAVAGHDALLVHGAPVSAEVLDAAPLRLVCCARGGPVNIDVAAASRRGIPVTNAPGRNAQAGYLVDGGQLAENTYEGSGFIGAEAASMTLGLVGMGNVGREVAVRGRALGFTMLGYDPVSPATVPPGVTMVTLNDLLSHSGLISLHARATPDNRHLLSAAAVARMPRGAFVINTARESLVDEDALAGALASGILAGAALDVVERRPAGDRHPLLDLPNVIITPHIGGATRQTLHRGAEMTASAVARMASGDIPDHLVNPEVLARKEVAP
jgi:D-3-phosphoglycerate dehydrogenase / 2-oxoglutarate reductase